MANEQVVRAENSLVAIEAQQLAASPKLVLEQAMVAAKALQDVISKKKNPVVFNNEQYLEFEDWQTLARFYGYTAKVRETNYVEYGSVHGFEAKADVMMIANDQVVSSAEAMCLNDEEKWSTRASYEWKEVIKNGKKVWDETMWGGKGGYVKEKVKVGEVAVPLFQLRSMAQTRACAKALRNVLAWVVVLAGYRPTPVEEITDGEDRGQQSNPAPAAAAKSTGKAPGKAQKAAPDPDTTPVMCNQCRQVGSHAKDCPTQNKQEYMDPPAGLKQERKQEVAVPTRQLFVDKITQAKSKTGTAYLTLETTDRDDRFVVVYCYHKTLMEQSAAWPGAWCDFVLSEKPSKDGKKVFLAIEDIIGEPKVDSPTGPEMFPE
jgi:hypothetical protein